MLKLAVNMKAVDGAGDARGLVEYVRGLIQSVPVGRAIEIFHRYCELDYTSEDSEQPAAIRATMWSLFYMPERNLILCGTSQHTMQDRIYDRNILDTLPSELYAIRQTNSAMSGVVAGPFFYRVLCVHHGIYFLCKQYFSPI